MKATGIVRRVDDLGRVVIPKELRNTLKIKDGDPLEIFVDGEKVIFRKYQPGCCLCGNEDRELISLYPEKLVCKHCVEIIVKNESNLIKSFDTN
ncbi:AbrB/MazE/SpoVT family DNA-binding domain-containing protein [Paenibacillus chibensis]|uniref:AbrB/MazE/SpoVT family DNA-binding domain-containing protein n=1 Tax=Paenibacillus chibensis TaxID=59846 RepID=A0ABU6PWQ7_9BACL|nr:AbrB/MazE/SpoVT family DNA-binding domain-containing protein [Paenibacillus chibensis]